MKERSGTVFGNESQVELMDQTQENNENVDPNFSMHNTQNITTQLKENQGDELISSFARFKLQNDTSGGTPMVKGNKLFKINEKSIS